MARCRGVICQAVVAALVATLSTATPLSVANVLPIPLGARAAAAAGDDPIARVSVSSSGLEANGDSSVADSF